MRAIANIPHPSLRITIHAWNEKYFLEVEAGSYKISFKIPQDRVRGVDEIQGWVDEDFTESCIAQFESLHELFSKTYRKHQSPSL
ncbi:MAG: hypothetical protein ACKOZY_08375 [Flavobacteriales bacterium]